MFIVFKEITESSCLRKSSRQNQSRSLGSLKSQRNTMRKLAEKRLKNAGLN